MGKDSGVPNGEVIKQLCWDSSLDTKNIRVERAQGKILLTGSVPYYAGRVNAFRDALNASGGLPVVNRLTVDFPSGAPQAPDEMLEANILDLLNLLSWASPDKVRVRVARRLVYLSGETEFLWQKHKLEKLIGEFKGVAAIMNEIEVRPGRRLSDKRIARDIVDSLNRVSGLDSSRLSIRVARGRVFLEGRARNYPEMNAVERAAAMTRGVIDVINDLSIG